MRGGADTKYTSGGDERNMPRGAGIGGVVRGLCRKRVEGKGKTKGKE